VVVRTTAGRKLTRAPHIFLSRPV